MRRILWERAADAERDSPGGRAAMACGDGPRLVFRAGLAGRQQLHSATAINELEMWQSDTFDPQRIDLELGWAEGLGMNTMRVLPARSAMAAGRCGLPAENRRVPEDRGQAQDQADVRPFRFMLGSVAAVGKAAAAGARGVHNSGWVQSPGAKALEDPAQYMRLETYVKRCNGGIRERQANPGVGYLERAGQSEFE